MAKKDAAPAAEVSRPLALQVIAGAAALALAWHVSMLAWALVLLIVSAVISRRVTAAWWVARSRRFGRELEVRSLADLGRLCKLCRVSFDANVDVPGLGDADALLGRKPVVLEIKSFRRWNMDDGRCVDAIRQIERLMCSVGSQRGLIWLPQGELTFIQRLGLGSGMPSNIQLVAGPAWHPLMKVLLG
jgi:hypothetical protein